MKIQHIIFCFIIVAGGCKNSMLVKHNTPPITHSSTLPTVPRVQIEMVSLPTGIKMGKYEVTQGQWRSVMGTNPSHFQQCGDNCPVELVSRRDIEKFIKQLNLQTRKHFRLPTGDEWYAACQAGKKTRYCGSDNVNDVAWYEINSNGKTHPVGMKKPNAWGLYDMSGNVWEWTDSECYNGNHRLCVRGGAFFISNEIIMSGGFALDVDSDRVSFYGFRLVLNPYVDTWP